MKDRAVTDVPTKDCRKGMKWMTNWLTTIPLLPTVLMMIGPNPDLPRDTHGEVQVQYKSGGAE